MGSKSDLPVMKEAIDILKNFDIEIEVDIVSAHRTPEKMMEYGKKAHQKGLQVIIAGAGGAAHLPGMLASMTYIPVLGVPILSKALSGMDSLLSIAQMPSGIPVGTLAIGDAGACNAGIMAAQILAINNKFIEIKVKNYRIKQTKSVKEKPETYIEK